MKKFIVTLVAIISLGSSLLFSQTGWFQQTSGTTETFTTVFFLNDQTGFAGGGFTIFKTTNGGTIWTAKVLPDTSNLTSIRFLNNTTGYACSGITINSNWSRQFLFKTTNTGDNWTKIYESSGTLTSEAFNDVFPIDSLIYLTKGGWGMFGTTGSMYVSQNNGTNFSLINVTNSEIIQKTRFINSQTGWVISSYGDDVGWGKRKIFKTTNHGVNWIRQYRDSTTNTPLSYPNFELQFIDQNTGFGLYYCYPNTTKFLKSTNSGVTWDSTSLPYSKYNTMFFADSNTGWIGGNCNTDSVMIIRTTNGGTNWQVQKRGNNIINSVFFANNLTGWAVGNNGLILKTITGGVTGVKNVSSEVPATYSLGQNYPNPFNPTTNIKFSIVNSGDVKLVVYDIQGREVQTLVNERLNAGTYETKFDGSMLTSGVYFYKMVSESFTETKRMFLIK